MLKSGVQDLNEKQNEVQEIKQRQAFKERTHRFAVSAARAAHEWYDRDGNWIASTKPAETRERFLLSKALYSVGEEKWADAIIGKGDTARYGAICFNIFDTNIAVSLLIEHRDKMSAEIRQKLERLVKDGFSFKPGNRQPDYQFHGYNDNMPAEATKGLILGGELMDSMEAVEHGLWNLRQLSTMLYRNGINSEYNSPTYTANTITAIAEIAEFARNDEARRLALGIEERLWVDIAARFHPEMGIMSGPYSRAYTIDTIAHSSSMSGVLWFCLGDRANPSPMELFNLPEELVIHHIRDIPFNVSAYCNIIGGEYHIPPIAMKMFEGKKYPFHAVATNEQGNVSQDFPARPSCIKTVLFPDYTLGTANTPMLNGTHSCSYFVTYKRQEQVQSFRDIGTIFTKFAINGELPGNMVYAKEIPAAGEEYRKWEQKTLKVYTNFGEEDYLSSYSNIVTVQSGPTAMVLTHPQLSLGGSGDEQNSEALSNVKPLTDLSELIIFSAHGGKVDELMVGGVPRQEWSGTVKHGQWIACRIGKLLVAFRPMAYTREQGQAQITLESNNKYQFIHTNFYKGEPRRFLRSELRDFFGGFVAEHASVSEYSSLSSFAKELESARFTDYFWTTRRVRYERKKGSARPAIELETSWSPGSTIPRYAAIDGCPVETPVLKIDGINNEELPFLNMAPTPIPPFFPWKDLKVEWGDWPYAIGDREL